MKKDNIGYIHSIETMGLVDGPGIRFVVFLQGCPLRCIFCHNPDTWQGEIGIKTTPHELVEKIERYRPYFEDNGGVTFSGGEPLFQSEFLLECLKLCHERNIHTCIDTCGVGLKDYDEILKYTDLVLWDVKAYRQDDYKNMTGKNIEDSLKFLKRCQDLNKEMWIRQVIVPGINDNIEYIKGLADFIRPIKNVQKIEFLPYELLGVHKYKELNIPYRLDGVQAMDHEKCNQLYQKFLTYLH